MRKKTVKQQILEYLQANGGEHHSGKLQRENFVTEDGGLATGDTIKRRANELVKAGLAFARKLPGKNQVAFSANPAAKPKTQVVEIRDGKAYLSYV